MSNQIGRFQIERGDELYGLEGTHGVKTFQEVYEPLGFKISKVQPNDWVAPVIDKPKKAESPAKKDEK